MTHIYRITLITLWLFVPAAVHASGPQHFPTCISEDQETIDGFLKNTDYYTRFPNIRMKVIALGSEWLVSNIPFDSVALTRNEYFPGSCYRIPSDTLEYLLNSDTTIYFRAFFEIPYENDTFVIATSMTYKDGSMVYYRPVEEIIPVLNMLSNHDVDTTIDNYRISISKSEKTVIWSLSPRDMYIRDCIISISDTFSYEIHDNEFTYLEELPSHISYVKMIDSSPQFLNSAKRIGLRFGDTIPVELFDQDGSLMCKISSDSGRVRYVQKPNDYEIDLWIIGDVGGLEVLPKMKETYESVQFNHPPEHNWNRLRYEYRGPNFYTGHSAREFSQIRYYYQSY